MPAWYEIHKVKIKIIEVRENPNFRRNYQQDSFCAAWYEIYEAGKTRTYFVPHGMKFMVRKKPEL